MALALSLKQPWAELILEGKKTIETRNWDTKIRGEFYIHASKTIDLEACKNLGINPSSLVTGSIIGKANLVNVKEYISEDEFMKDDNKHLAGFFGFSRPKFGFVLDNVKRTKIIPMKGNLGFFEVNVNGV